MRDKNFYILILSEKKETADQQILSVIKVQELNDENNTLYILSEKNFAVLIK